MTSPLEQVVAALTDTEAKILARYAASEPVDTIADRTETSRAEVARVIEEIANSNRQYARTIAIAHNHERRNPAVAAAVAAKPTAAASKPADTIADLLTRAVDSSVPKLIRAADKIQDLIDELEVALGAHEQEAKLRTEAAELEQRLAAIRLQLGGPPTDTKAIRAWAAANGIDCPARGQVPKAVLAAYQEKGGAGR